MNRPTDISEKLELGRGAKAFSVLCVLMGMAVLGGLFVYLGQNEEEYGRFFQAYLVNFAFFLSLSLGGLFFVILQHLTRSGWSVVLRRFAEVIAGNLLWLAMLFLPVVMGMDYLYKWTHAELVKSDHLLHHKEPYLNTPFFLIRWVAYFAIWILLSHYYLSRSRRQDTGGDPKLTLNMERLSPVAMILFGFSLTLASFDLLMSLAPHWFSTMFGVYYFSGGVVAIFAVLPLLVYVLQLLGRADVSITIEHYQDMGKLLFGFVVFWAYIAYSQYMLIWYANIPEETMWYLDRQSGQWAWVSLILLFGHFAIPFLALISRNPKRYRPVLLLAGLWMLVMHWIDIYWLVMPQFSREQSGLNWMHGGCFLAIGLIYLGAFVGRLARGSLIPVQDPRLPESLAFENY